MTALQRLPRATRETVVLHHLADLPVAEVAVALGCSLDTVKARLGWGAGPGPPSSTTSGSWTRPDLDFDGFRTAVATTFVPRYAEVVQRGARRRRRRVRAAGTVAALAVAVVWPAPGGSFVPPPAP